MSNLKPCGTFPTPYGVSVPVFRPPELKLSDPDAFVFGMEATAICAGIHDKAERARFVADAKRLKVMPAIEAYGGGKLLHVPLPRPMKPLYPQMPGKEITPVEAWITGTMDHSRWCDRAAFLNDIIGENMEQAGIGDAFLDGLYPLSVSTLLTAALEHLGDIEIDCVEAAAMFAVTMHGEWIEVGIEWLEPVRDTWFRDWRDARPRYAAFARALAEPLDLPDWLHGTGGAR